LIDNREVIVMSNIGFEVLKLALIDAITKQKLIASEMQELPEHSKVHKLVEEQSLLLKEMMSLLNRIA
jgi:hypothetical protein